MDWILRDVTRCFTEWFSYHENCHLRKSVCLSLSDLALKIKACWTEKIDGGFVGKLTFEKIKKPSISVTKLATKTTLRLPHLSYWLTALFPPPISNDLSHNVSVFDKRTLLVLHSLKDVH